MLSVINPADHTLIVELDTDNADSISDKMAQARQAQREWATRPFAERVAIIKAFREALLEQADDLAHTLSSEMGKPVGQARGEIKATPARIDFFLEHAEALIETETITETNAQGERISYEPLGVIANISAWNYPYFVGANVFIPALLTGNAVLYKPSEHASLTGLAIAGLFQQAGLPDHLFTPIIGGGDVGAALLAQPIDGVFFTGSHATGAKIAAAAAAKLIPVQLELGGKDPVYVCEDTDVQQVAPAIADGAFYNTGQSCCSVERIYVHHSVYDAFVKSFVETVNGFVIGSPVEDETYIGPLFRESQLDHLEAQVADAKSKGATVLCGGERLKLEGNFFAPTVLTDVTHDMDVMTEESFGPIIGIMSVQDDDDALEKMNDTRYGLTAGVYTHSQERATHLMSKLNAGSVYWNCCDRVSPRLPWSGRGDSGLGVTLSHLGVRPFVQPKAWHLVLPKNN
jgi:acyl-CoA reductase-like NAD-dependent aldehyde dehydrogenase